MRRVLVLAVFGLVLGLCGCEPGFYALLANIASKKAAASTAASLNPPK